MNMLKIAINTMPMSTGHKVRGVGFYTKNLVEALEKDERVEIFKFTDRKDVKNVDVIHYPWFDLFFRSLSFKKNIPSVITIHDVIPLVFPKQFPFGIRGKINLFYQKKALNKCKYIITDSENSKNDIVKYLSIGKEKVKVILLAAEEKYKVLSDADLIRVKNKLKLPQRYILYVGDVNFTKNIPFLIEGFAKLKEEQKYQDLKLVLVGQAFLKKVDNIDHPELASLKNVNNLISANNLENEVVRLGFIDSNDLVGIYNLAKLYIQPSLYEGFGIPVLEAMKCGTPVLSSKTSSLPEVGGDAAVYFNPENQQEFIRFLKELLDDSSLRRKISSKGIIHSNKFSWEKVAKETINVYENTVI